MKKFNLFFCASLALCNFAFGQIKDSKGHMINSKGDIYFEGTKLGTVDKEQIVKDASGKKIAFLDSDGDLKDGNGKKLGKWGKDGKSFYSTEHVLLFTVKDVPGETCDILDAKGNVIGNVHDSLKGVACAIHCFQNQMKSKNGASSMRH